MREAALPTETFIPLKCRVLAIIQLCLAFSLLLWYGGQPFMGEYFQLKSHLLMHEYVLGTSSLLKSEEEKEKLQRNKLRFVNLSQDDQKIILSDYEKLVRYSNRPFYVKISDGIKTILNKIPPFELAWIIFAIVVSILLLRKQEGGREAAWLLFLITIIYCFNNFFYGIDPIKRGDRDLFPSESFLIQNYLREPFNSNFYQQKAQLELAWGNYLIANWGNQKQAASKHIQLEEAEFYFTIERIKHLIDSRFSPFEMPFNSKIHPLWLLLFLIWNLFFSLNMNRLKIS